jgi:hypothetical protein
MIFHGWNARRYPYGSKLCIRPPGTGLPLCSRASGTAGQTRLSEVRMLDERRSDPYRWPRVRQELGPGCPQHDAGDRSGLVRRDRDRTAARGWPWLNAAQWIPQLEAVIELQRRAGRQTFLVAATPETEQELRAVVDAVGVEQVVIVCLSAPADLAAGRVADREPDSWPGKLPLVEHARKLAREIQSLGGIDLVLSTVDQQAAEVATEVKRLLAVKGILRTG